MIGTWAGPRDAGTAGVRLMHNLGLIGGWGYVEGGMGRVSFALADAATEAGRGAGHRACRWPGSSRAVASDWRTGPLVRAAVVVSNADPHRTLALVGDDAPSPRGGPGSRRGTSAARCVKLNCGLQPPAHLHRRPAR